MVIRKGGMRFVILTSKYAIKFPLLTSMDSFLSGWLANDKEYQWTGCILSARGKLPLCPVIWRSWLSFVIVMPRCLPVRNERLFGVDLEGLCAIARRENNIAETFIRWDAHAGNFGYLNGRLVKIDYAKLD